MGETSIAVAVISTLSQVVRRRFVEELRGGDVACQRLREAIESDLDTIKGELRGIARNDLLSGISNYEDGISLITFSKVPVSEVDGSTRTEKNEDDVLKLMTAEISQRAKERFKIAREETHRAFNVEGLSVQDRILATKFCVKAQILESEDNPIEALTLCKGYLKKMHNLQEVKSNFSLEVNSGRRAWNIWRNTRRGINVAERRRIISSVCEVNRIVFDIAQFVADDERQLYIWPCVKIDDGKEEIDPLRDRRLRRALHGDQNMNEEEFFVDRSFGHEILRLPHSIATTRQDEFIVVDGTKAVVFANTGKYRYNLKLPSQDGAIQYDIVDVDTDRDCKVYLLVEIRAIEGYTQKQFEVFVFHEQTLHLHFKLEGGSIGRKLAVNSRRGTETEVLILEGGKDVHAMVEVYNIHGKFVERFNGRILHDAQDIVAASDGHIFVLDSYGGGKCVREFNASRKHLHSFGVDPHSVAITFDRASGHIVIVSAEYDDKKKVYCENVSIYDNKDPLENKYNIKRRPVRPMKLAELGSSPKQNIAITAKGRIAVAFRDDRQQGKVVVV